MSVIVRPYISMLAAEPADSNYMAAKTTLRDLTMEVKCYQ